jgi:uncharacterized membrane protein
LSDLKATSGSVFKLKLYTSDDDPEDRSVLKFTLGGHPDGMTVDEKGNIEWKPTSYQVGSNSVKVHLSDGIDDMSYSFDIDVRSREGGSQSLVLIILVIVILIIAIGGILFLVLRKQRVKKDKDKDVIQDETAEIIADMERHKQGEESMDLHAPAVVQSDVPLSPAEAHANLGKDRPKSYEEMYGTPAPKQEEGLTAAELREEIGEMAEELESELKEIDQ